MKNKIYSIYDEKAQVYNTPFFQSNDAIAERSFKDLAADKSSTINRHPADYKLYEIGEFDDFSGVIVPRGTPRFICAASVQETLEL